MNSITSIFFSLKNISHEAFIGFTEKTVTFPNSGLQTEYLKNILSHSRATTATDKESVMDVQIKLLFC